jgi:hypothetical protein
VLYGVSCLGEVWSVVVMWEVGGDDEFAVGCV